MGLRMGPELTRIDPQIDLQTMVPRWPSDDPQMTISRTSGNLCSRIGLISCFIDGCWWKRPPVQGLDTPAYLFPRMTKWLIILPILITG